MRHVRRVSPLRCLGALTPTKSSRRSSPIPAPPTPCDPGLEDLNRPTPGLQASTPGRRASKILIRHGQSRRN